MTSPPSSPRMSKKTGGVPRFFLLTVSICLFTSLNVILMAPIIRSQGMGSLTSMTTNVGRMLKLTSSSPLVKATDYKISSQINNNKNNKNKLPKLFHTSGMDKKPTVPMSLIIPCQNEDMTFLPLVLESVANQTVYPEELILVMNIAPKAADGVLMTRFGSLRSSSESVIKSLLAVNNSAFSVQPAISRGQVMKSRVPVEISLNEIPNVSIYVRSGVHYAGDNRVYGALKASKSTKLVSFFDCDDYLHPYRTAYVYRTFKENPELEVLIHGFTVIRMSTWAVHFNNFMQKKKYLDELNFTFPVWPYKMLQDKLPVEPFVNLTQKEPSQIKDDMWFYPKGMGLPRYPGLMTMGHNGWITAKKDVLNRVPYPVDLRRGQDSLYNWRLLKNKVKFNNLPIQLAAYVRQN